MDAELAEIRDFLAQHAPFDALPADLLDRLVTRLEVRYSRRGSTIVAVDAPGDAMYVLRSGAVDVRDRSGDLVDRVESGACFGMSALLDGSASAYDFTALEDSLLLALPARDFAELYRSDLALASHLDREHRRRLGRVTTAQVRESVGPGMRTRARDLVRREPKVADVTVTIRDAAARMRDDGVSSLLLMDADRLVGIVTDRDLRNRVVAENRDPSDPVSSVMTADPVTASGDALVFELLMEMVARNIHHLPLVDREGVVGVVTSTDLMRLEHADPVYLVGDVRKARSVQEVAAAASRLPDTVQQLVTSGATHEDVGRVTTTIGDAVERRLIDLALDDLGPAPVPWCWVVLGSRARLEQALGADQDHCLVLSDEVRPEHDAYFTALAERVTAGLELCGRPRCRGAAMATNARWRQSVSAWRATFMRWFAEPEPKAVMESSIFFDMRPVHGDGSLVTSLQAWVVARVPQQQIFLAYLTKQALETAPPIGFFRGFVLERAGEHVATLDLKHKGIGPVVALVRVHALAAGLPQVGTLARIRALVAAGRLDPDTGADLAGAFEIVGQARLQHQARQVRSDRTPDNYVVPSALTSFDKRNLRDAFSIVKHAQAALSRRQPLHFLS